MACSICGEEGGASCTQMLPTPALQDLRDVTGRQHWGVDPRPMTGASPPTFAAYYAGHPGGPGGLLAVACGGCRGGCPRIRFARGQLCAAGVNLLWGYGLGGVKRCEPDGVGTKHGLKKGTFHSCVTFSLAAPPGPSNSRQVRAHREADGLVVKKGAATSRDGQAGRLLIACFKCACLAPPASLNCLNCCAFCPHPRSNACARVCLSARHPVVAHLS